MSNLPFDAFDSDISNCYGSVVPEKNELKLLMNSAYGILVFQHYASEESEILLPFFKKLDGWLKADSN